MCSLKVHSEREQRAHGEGRGYGGGGSLRPCPRMNVFEPL